MEDLTEFRRGENQRGRALLEQMVVQQQNLVGIVA
jgi:hypothetical protein